MEFSLDRFYKLNRKAIIWIILFGLIYKMRDYFTLIFLTFIFSFFAYPASKYLQERLKLNQIASVTLVYLGILGGYIAVGLLVLPNVVGQASSIQTRLPEIQAQLDEVRLKYSKKHPEIVRLFKFDLESPTLLKEDILVWEDLLQQLGSTNSTKTNFSREFLPRIRALLSEDLRQEIDEYNLPPGENDDASKTSEAKEADKTHDRTKILTEELEDAIIKELNLNVIDSADQFSEKAFPSLKDTPSFLLPNGEKPEVDTVALPEMLSVWKSLNQADLPIRKRQKFNRFVLENSFGNTILTRRYSAEQKINSMISEWSKDVQKLLLNLALLILNFLRDSLLAILFSFLIVFDYAKLSKEVKGLQKSTKLRDFFIEAGQPVVKFAISVGEGFRAIATIALITTCMVVVALFCLGVPSLAFLAVVTFLTSLVPVVGIFFEFIPVALVAFNKGDISLMVLALLALTIIHVIIGYVITPIIFGRRFKINVVAVIFILFIGNEIAGVWGMILGVPIANYILKDVLGVHSFEATEKRGEEAPRSTQSRKSSPS
jgi:predicted PurR-regulated permease PerM